MNKLNKKVLALCLSISVSGMANSSELNNCVELNPDNYKDFISNVQPEKIKNPFSDNCVSMSYKEKDSTSLTVSDFDDNEEIKKLYDSFLNNDLTNVSMIYNPENEKIYSFFKFNLNSEEINEFKSLAKRSRLRNKVDEFIFLHELFHLNSEITRSKDISIGEKELISDVAAVIMMSSTHDMSPKDTEKLMRGVRKVRESLSRNSSHGGRDVQGDKNHYSRKDFNKIVSFFEDLNDANIKIEKSNFKDVLSLSKQLVLSNENSKEKIIAKIKNKNLEDDIQSTI